MVIVSSLFSLFSGTFEVSVLSASRYKFIECPQMSKLAQVDTSARAFLAQDFSFRAWPRSSSKILGDELAGVACRFYP